MIIETLFSTIGESGTPNYAPMGIEWGDTVVVMRPFHSSHTYQNLKKDGYGVVNVTDHIKAIVETALADVNLPHFNAQTIPGVVYKGACHWLEVKVQGISEHKQRAAITCSIIDKGWIRNFLGFNRAQNMLIEGTILATRIFLTNPQEVLNTVLAYDEVIKKTGGTAETEAYQYLVEYIRRWINGYTD